MTYLDTSVLTAYYCPEPRSPAVQRTLSRVQSPTISPLVEVELCCAIARKARAGEIQAADARRIVALFQLHMVESRFAVVPIQAAEYGLARDWITQFVSPLRVLDALHMAAAFSHGMRLLTADRDLARSAQHFGVKNRLIP